MFSMQKLGRDLHLAEDKSAVPFWTLSVIHTLNMTLLINLEPWWVKATERLQFSPMTMYHNDAINEQLFPSRFSSFVLSLK